MSNPGHRNQDNIRGLLRVVGPVILGVGVIFVAMGLISFFASFGSFSTPRFIWAPFVGMPLIAVGAGMTQFAFMGAVGRYVAGEVAPIAKDTVNYMAEETRDAVRHVSESIGAGLNQSRPPLTFIRCHKCNAENQAQAKFCNSCGTALLKSKPCPNCGELNDPDARFCDNCGHGFIS